MHTIRRMAPGGMLVCLVGIAPTLTAQDLMGGPDWDDRLAMILPVLGHGNWIVVADMAYPARVRPGFETVYVAGDQLSVLKKVLELVDRMSHVRGVIHLDTEFKYVSESDARGADRYRQDLQRAIRDREVRELPHGDMVAYLDESAATFRVLVLKSETKIPYSTACVRLECAYWNADAEKRLRDQMREEEK